MKLERVEIENYRAIEKLDLSLDPHRIRLRPLRFAVSLDSEAGKPEELALDQLSGGYRIVLALTADLARRMAQGNPHLADPLESEAVVLIDEIDLHLHPGWQQNPCPWNQGDSALAGYRPSTPSRRKPSPVHALRVNPD